MSIEMKVIEVSKSICDEFVTKKHCKLKYDIVKEYPKSEKTMYDSGEDLDIIIATTLEEFFI